MAIYEYEEDGKIFWKAYAHVRSRISRSRRLQKYTYRHKTEAEARREERKLLQKLTREIERIDSKGLDWKDIIHLYGLDLKAQRLGEISDRSAEGYLSILNKWTRSWMDLPAADLGRADGRDLLIRMEKEKCAKAYQNKIKNVINKVFEWGVEYRHIIGNTISPAKGIMVKRASNKVPDILTLEEIKKFLRAAQGIDHLWYPIWAFAIMTGMRSGELHALTWDQVDLEKNIVMVDRSYDSNSKRLGPTKGRYWRTVPVSNSLKKLILDLKRVQDKPDKGHFVLPRIREWDNGDQAVSLKNFLTSIGLKPIRFHALRACFATQMLASGVSAPVVMKIGGWKQMSTMDIYLRLAGVDIKGATECLNFIPEEIKFGENVTSIFGDS